MHWMIGIQLELVKGKVIAFLVNLTFNFIHLLSTLQLDLQLQLLLYTRQGRIKVIMSCLAFNLLASVVFFAFLISSNWVLSYEISVAWEELVVQAHFSSLSTLLKSALYLFLSFSTNISCLETMDFDSLRALEFEESLKILFCLISSKSQRNQTPWR